MIKNNGYIALISFLVIGAVSLAIAVSTSFLGIEQAKSSLTTTRGEQAFWLGKSCLNQALINLRDNNSYSGGELTTELGSCTISIGGEGLKTIAILVSLNDKPDLNRNFSAKVRLSSSHIRLLEFMEI